MLNRFRIINQNINSMNNFSLFLLVALMAFSSCHLTAQNNKTLTSTKALHLEKKEVIVDLNVTEFKSEMEEENAVLLDVRTPQETAQGMIEGAIEIDVRNPNFIEKIQALDKSKTYLVYCRSGRRSTAACNIMEEEGFEDLKNLLGGFNKWSTAGK